MLGGLLIWGLQPGPTLMKGHPDFVWASSPWGGRRPTFRPSLILSQGDFSIFFTRGAPPTPDSAAKLR